MKTIVFTSFLVIVPLLTKAQSREFYFGSNVSNYYYFTPNTDLNTNAYLPGAQLGFRWGRKEKNLFKNQKRLQLKMGLEYNFAQIQNPSDTLHRNTIFKGKQLHSVRAGIPVRFLFNRKQKVNFFLEGEPGVNVNVFQQEDRTDAIIERIPLVDLYLKVGLGTKFNLGKDQYEKKGYKLSAISLSATKYISIDPFKTNSTKTGVLDQFMFNMGFSFGYYKPTLRNRLNVFGKGG